MKLVFVYNADAGRVNALLDIAHKVISPQTYECALCKLTHAALAEKEAWREFRQSAPMEMEFLHRDEFGARYDVRVQLPAILRVGARVELALSAEEIGACGSVQELIARVREVMERPADGEPGATRTHAPTGGR